MCAEGGEGIITSFFIIIAFSPLQGFVAGIFFRFDSKVSSFLGNFVYLHPKQKAQS